MDRKWFGTENGTVYVMYRLADEAWAHTETFDQGQWISGDLRCDPAPCWNRTSHQVLFPSIAADGTRQMFIMSRS